MSRGIFNAAICLLVSAALSLAQHSPRIIRFDVPGAFATSPTSINDAGAIAGLYVTASGVVESFVRAPDGTITAIAIPGAAQVRASSINAEGAVTGTYSTASGNLGFLRSASGAITSFAVPAAGTVPGQGTFPMSIDARGQIVGTYTNATGIAHGFLREPTGEFAIIDGPGPSGTNTIPLSINADGVMTGYLYVSATVLHGFIASHQPGMTTFITFNAPGTIGETFAYSINDLGFVTGIYLGINPLYSAYLRAPSGDLTSFNVSGATSTNAVAINNQNDIAGYARLPNQSSLGFFRTSDGTLTTFNVPGAGTAIGQGTFPASINNIGQITGYYTGSNLVHHGFLLIP